MSDPIPPDPGPRSVASTRPEPTDLETLAIELGVHLRYVDGLGREVEVSPETLVRVCRALGVDLPAPEDAADALVEHRRAASERLIPPVLVAWDGMTEPIPVRGSGPIEAILDIEGDGATPLEVHGSTVRTGHPIPFGYHRLLVRRGAHEERTTVISAPTRAWRDPEARRSWGLGTQLAALRSSRSRSLGDLRDLETLCRWVGERGGDLVTVLPLLPTFNDEPAEPSPYSPVSRLFWSELVLDLGGAHHPTPEPDRLDVVRADAEVRAALAGRPLPDRAGLDAELLRYAAFRGAQARLGRNWRDWPEDARAGRLEPEHVDSGEERFHLVAQSLVRHQLGELRGKMAAGGVRLGLDLAVGVHPDGYDPWSRQHLFAPAMSVGAPPDGGFPSGQDWGFSPVLPAASREEGHRYIAASIAHQARLAGVLRVDHVMALTRLYWIPHGLPLDQGTYVSYPAEELFAVVTLESHRTECEVIGENLGTVPPEIDAALPRHAIRGMFLAQFEAMSPEPGPPDADEVALIGTHDTPTLAGWIAGVDIDERVRCGLLDADAAPGERDARADAVARLAELLESDPDDTDRLLGALLDWLGESESPLVVPWIEDLWLEEDQVNLPGTRSSERPNWQRPMRRLLDEALADPTVAARVARLESARARPAVPSPTPPDGAAQS